MIISDSFEPGQLVLVRDNDISRWKLYNFSHEGRYPHPYYVIGVCASWNQCIPFNDETKHLQNTCQPYEPPVDESTRFKAGEVVEIFSRNDGWNDAIYLCHKPDSSSTKCNQHKVYSLADDYTFTQPPNQIRKKE